MTQKLEFCIVYTSFLGDQTRVCSVKFGQTTFDHGLRKALWAPIVCASETSTEHGYEACKVQETSPDIKTIEQRQKKDV